MRQFKIITLAFIFIAFLISCSKDSDPTPNVNVPSGEIVALDQRDITLTGEGVNLAGEPITQIKWWHGVNNVNIFTGCGEQDDEIKTDLSEYYVAFYLDGSVYQKVGISGTPFKSQNWNWSDESKTKMYLSLLGLTFDVKFLNDDNVVYSYQQTVQGTCVQVVYEQYNDPHFE